jgi:hypothetical protein
MTVPSPVLQLPYVRPDGSLTPVGYALLQAMAEKINELEARIAALEP